MISLLVEVVTTGFKMVEATISLPVEVVTTSYRAVEAMISLLVEVVTTGFKVVEATMPSSVTTTGHGGWPADTSDRQPPRVDTINPGGSSVKSLLEIVFFRNYSDREGHVKTLMGEGQ